MKLIGPVAQTMFERRAPTLESSAPPGFARDSIENSVLSPSSANQMFSFVQLNARFHRFPTYWFEHVSGEADIHSTVLSAQPSFSESFAGKLLTHCCQNLQSTGCQYDSRMRHCWRDYQGYICPIVQASIMAPCHKVPGRKWPHPLACSPCQFR